LDLSALSSAKTEQGLVVSATVATSDSDTNQANNRGAFVLRIKPAMAALSVESGLDGTPLIAGEPAKFATTVKNWGMALASDSALTDAKDRKSTRLNSSHEWISYAVVCLKKKRQLKHKQDRSHTKNTHDH